MLLIGLKKSFNLYLKDWKLMTLVLADATSQRFLLLKVKLWLIIVKENSYSSTSG